MRKLGATRTVFLIRNYAVKIAGHWTFVHWRYWWRSLLTGLLCNMQERNFAQTGWEQLCPLRFYVFGGFLLVMPRTRPLTDVEWSQFDYRKFVTREDHYAECNYDKRATANVDQPLAGLFLGGAEPEGLVIPVEFKRDSFGVLDGRIVAIDYG